MVLWVNYSESHPPDDRHFKGREAHEQHGNPEHPLRNKSTERGKRQAESGLGTLEVVQFHVSFVA